ncbi:MAG: hypothetical protein KDK99_09845 [Verrucomicrobiales bacterium]|nr:hypothetical protein [Verrucomicrobiales bacterium]
MPKIISNRPWLAVVLLFAGFLALWVMFYLLAVKNQPPTVPVAGQEEESEKGGQ